MSRSRTQLSISRLESLEKRLREKLEKLNASILNKEEDRDQLEADINGVVAGLAALREIAGQQGSLDEALSLEAKAPMDRALSTNGHDESPPFEDFRTEGSEMERVG